MRRNKRMVVMGLVTLALMTLSMTLSMARSWGPNPLFVAPGIHEEGAYTMMVPGTYGHLIPILPFPWAKDPIPSKFGDSEQGDVVTPVGHQGSNASGGGLQASAPKGGGGLGNLAPGSMGMPLGNYSTGGAMASNHVNDLENGLRDAIRKLHSR